MKKTTTILGILATGILLQSCHNHELDSLRNELANKQEQISNLQAELDYCAQMVGNHEETIADLVHEYESLQQTISIKQNETWDLESNFWSVTSALDDLESAVRRFDRDPDDHNW